MNFDLLIPITLFASIAYSIKAVVDAYTRRRIIESRGSEELVRSLLEGEATRRRLAALQWGSVCLALAVGFGLVELTGSPPASSPSCSVLPGWEIWRTTPWSGS